jgi:hypothetical protein
MAFARHWQRADDGRFAMAQRLGVELAFLMRPQQPRQDFKLS